MTSIMNLLVLKNAKNISKLVLKNAENISKLESMYRQTHILKEETERDLEESERSMAFYLPCFSTINFKGNSGSCSKIFLARPFHSMNPLRISCDIKVHYDY